MSVPTIFDLCEPRADVRAGTSSEFDFAADLSHVIRGTGGPVEYSDPARFFANTYPTRGLREPACQRLYPADRATRSGGSDLPSRYQLRRW